MFRKLCFALSILYLVGVAGALRAQAPAGTISTYAGGGRLNLDGVLATDYQLNRPSDVAIDPSGERLRRRQQTTTRYVKSTT